MEVKSDHYYVVRCEDGMRRHEDAFGELWEAQHWADWGHCCTNKHTYSLHSYNGHSECADAAACAATAARLRRLAVRVAAS